MKKLVLLVGLLFSVPAMAQEVQHFDVQPITVERRINAEGCVPSDQYNCEKTRGCKWVEANRTCTCTKWRTRTKWRTKKVPVEKIVNVPQKVEVLKEKEVIKYLPAPKPPITKTKPATKPTPKRQWWWLSGGVFATGLWYGEEFLTGPMGQLKFAISDRFRVSSNVGYSVWQPALTFGADFGVHLKEWHEGLFLNFSLTTIWTKYTDFFTVRHREFLGGLGGEYWLTKYLSVSLDFLLGVKSYLPSVDESPVMGRVVAGNRFSLMLHL